MEKMFFFWGVTVQYSTVDKNLYIFVVAVDFILFYLIFASFELG